MASKVDGSVVIEATMDISDAEKELARLKNRVFKLEHDIGEKRAQRAALEKKYAAKKAEYDDFLRKNTEVDDQGAFMTPEAGKKAKELYNELLKINAELKKYDDALEKSNVTMDFTKQRYGEIASLARQLGSAQENAEENQLQEMSNHARETMKWISNLQDELDDLLDRKSSLGLALGAREEYAEIQSQIDSVTQHLENMRSELDDLAISGALGNLASGSEIAEQRISELSDELADLEQQQENLGMAFGAKQEYNDLSAEIERVNNLLEAYENNLGEDAGLRAIARDAEVADQRIVDLCDELEELRARQEELEAAGVGLGYQEYDKNTARITGIKQELKEYRKGLKETGSAADQAAEKMASIMSKMAVALNGGGTSAVLEEISTSIAGISPQTMVAVEAVNLLKAAADAVARKFKDFFRSFLDEISKGAELLKQFSKVAVKAFSRAVMGLVELLSKANVFPKMFSSIGKSVKSLGNIIRQALVFSVIYKGLSMVRQQMTAYLNVNAQFSTALRRLKGVLLTAFQPIYEVVLPALTALINVVSRAVAAVAQFIAVLFGKTAKQAQQNAKDLYEQANATTAAGDAAEEAALQMASFDEINKLDGSKSAGSGGGGAVDTGPLFDWEYEDAPFDSWGEAFSAFLDKILANIPKLREAFKNFADWLNDWSKKVYDMFTFPGVLEKVKQLGVELAQALNDLVNWINWRQLGEALGAGLNLALNFLTSFLYAFEWMNLGYQLAQFINGLVSQIDWYEFGRLLWSGFKIGLETLAGFLVGLDMPQLADAASKIVIGFFTEMLNTIQRIPWARIGWQIAAFLVELNWYGMLSSVTDAIAAGLMAAVKALQGFLARIKPELQRIAKEIVTALIEFFRDKVQWEELARTLGDGISTALQFVASLLDPELFYEIGRAIGEFLVKVPWVEIFGSLTEVLANAINSAIALVRGLLDEMTPEKLREIAEGIAQKINEFVQKVDWAELGKVIHDGIDAALDFLITILDNLDWDSIGQAVVDFLSELRWGDLLAKWGTVVGKAIGGALKEIDLSDALSLGGDIVGGMFQGLVNKFNEKGGVSGWIKELLFNPFINGFKSLFGIHSPSTVMAEQGGFLISGLFEGISHTWDTITDFFGEKLDALKQTLSDAWENIKKTAGEKWESIKTDLGATWSKIRDTAKEKFDEVSKKVADSWENIKKEVPRKWEEIKTSLTTAWESVKTSAGEKFGEVKQNIIDKMGELKNHDWKSIGSTIMDGIWNGLKSIWNSVTSWASSAASWLANAFGGAKSSISSAGSNAQKYASGARMSTYAMPDANSYRIPALAQGAVIPPNREFLAVLGDQRSGNNLEGPESLFRQIVRDENGAMISVLQAILAAIREGKELSIDGTTFAKLVYGSYNKESGRVGVRLAEVRG